MKTALGTLLTLLFLTAFIFGTGMETADAKAKERHVESHGLKWIKQDSGTDVNFRGVCAVSKTVAWVSGPNGTVLRTENSGKTWITCSVPQAAKLDFRDIEAFDAHTAVVMGIGSPGVFYKTTDGGKSWNVVYKNSGKGIFFDSMAFWDRRNGIAFSDPVNGQFFLVRTENSGDTWQRIPPENFPVPVKGEAAFAASGTMIAVQGKSNVWFCTGGAAARVLRSNDRGDTWTVSDTPMIHGTPSEGSFGIVFSDEKNGVIVGGDYKKLNQKTKNIAVTTDGGKTWESVDSNQPDGFRECAVYIPAKGKQFMVTVGPSGSEYSTDGGRSWKFLGSIPLHSLSMAPGSAVGWAVGPNGQIAVLTGEEG